MGIKRREVEKRIFFAEHLIKLTIANNKRSVICQRRFIQKFLRKEAAHGFRNLSVIKIPVVFERLVTQIKTKIDFFVNKPVYFSRLPSCQNATALAAATFSESTPWDIGINTV